MAERLFGMETEYALSVLTPDGSSADCGQALSDLLGLVAKNYPHLRDPTNGFFLPTGGRLYVDCGLHPEYCTPECTTPFEVVRHVIAGEHILGNLAQELLASRPARWQTIVSRCNVDYSGSGTTWGCHESYLYSSTGGELSLHLIPHLITRVIYTGAGGFDSFSSGLEFMISPRMAHISLIRSGESTRSRGLFHTKNEPLTNKGYSRLHLLVGESLCSQLASVLKIGTTALIVAMADGRQPPAPGTQVLHPLRAMRAFSRDITLRSRARLQGGGSASALEIQRAYLRQAENCLRQVFMPPWAEEICGLWRKVLDDLENGQGVTDTSLDWPVKLALFRQRVRNAGLTWSSLPAWTAIVRRLNAALDRSEMRGQRIGVEEVLGPQSPIANTIAELTPALRTKGLEWDQLKSFLALRTELFEIDTTYGRLGRNGIFSQLDAAGVLNHRVDSVGSVDNDNIPPPPLSRAGVRGQLVRQLSGGNPPYKCDWPFISNASTNAFVDLNDPFETQVVWKEVEPRPARRLRPDIRMPLPPPPFDPVEEETFMQAICRRLWR